MLYSTGCRAGRFQTAKVVERNRALVVVPREGHEGDLSRSPYIMYNALRLAGSWAVAANGSHTDTITEKISAGTPVRDALALSLLVMDYEKDDYDTPRIAAAVPLLGDLGWLGVVQHEALVVKGVSLQAGIATYLATYEANDVQDTNWSEFDATSADDAAREIADGGAFSHLEKPVTSAAALAGPEGFKSGSHLV